MINSPVVKRVVILTLILSVFSLYANAAEITAASFEALKKGEIEGLASHSEKQTMEKNAKILKVNEDFAGDIYDKSKDIEWKTEELAALTKSEDTSKKSTEDTIKDLESEQSTKGLSPQERLEKSRKSLSKWKDKVGNNIKSKAKTLQEIPNKKEKRKAQAGASETLNGTSESVQVIVESIGEQLDLLYNYLDNELKDLQSVTGALLFAEQGRPQEGERRAVIDLCNYSKAGCSGDGSIGGTISSLTKTVKNTTNKVNEAKNAVNTAKEGAEAVGSITSDADATKQAISGMGI